ncbi:MAG: NUDIX hydrolase [Succinivibrionaceae bacterium]|nr:NUDIX hydrolase [Succinivibrionaceae bacterium]
MAEEKRDSRASADEGIINRRLDGEKLRWKETGCRHLIQNRWINFREQEFLFPDGTTFTPYYSYTRRDYAVIVATDADGNYICVRQFRQGIMKVTTEFPAGGLDHAGDAEYGSREDPADYENDLAAAKRELLEETGYESDDWHHLITVPSNATISSNYAYVWQARNCRKVKEQKLDDTEFLQIEIHTPEDLERLIFTGEFEQSIHVMGWLLAQRNNLLSSGADGNQKADGVRP